MKENEQESENRETVADIVAQMRYGKIPKHRTDHELLAIYADRIEASWKREKIEVEADALEVGGIVEATRHRPGNAAAMRKAMEKLDKLLFVGVDGYVHGQPDMTDEIERTIKSALSAPARNCDRRFASIKEARTAYCAECGRIISIWDGDESWLFESWLLAPAERKGE